MIDLHIHSTHSDGSYSVKEILELAEKNGVDALSITDHDSIGAYFELENIDIKKYYSGEIMTGVELNCVHEGMKIELLGYGFDYIKMNEWFDKEFSTEKTKLNLQKEVEYLYNKCLENNITINGDIIELYDISYGYPTRYIYNEIVKYSENNWLFERYDIKNSEDFYRICGGSKEFPLYINFDISMHSAKEISDIIRKYGGKVFIAHVYGYKGVNGNKLLESLIKSNIIDGIEVFYVYFSKEQINYLKNFCEQNNYLISGGTDFHGKRSLECGVTLGKGKGNLNISKDLILKFYI